MKQTITGLILLLAAAVRAAADEVARAAAGCDNKLCDFAVPLRADR